MTGFSEESTRRNLLSMFGKGVLTLGTLSGGLTSRSGLALAQQVSPGDIAARDKWLDGLFEKKALVNTLQISRFVERMYFLTKPIAWTPNPGQPYQRVDVPSGFVTDFASIPRIFWTALPPDGEYAYAAVIHDYLYWKQTRKRSEADAILKFAMQDLQVDTITTNAIYAGVRVGGWSAWSENAKLKKSGEKRVLKKVPDDPTTRWEGWKKRPDVFAD